MFRRLLTIALAFTFLGSNMCFAADDIPEDELYDMLSRHFDSEQTMEEIDEQAQWDEIEALLFSDDTECKQGSLVNDTATLFSDDVYNNTNLLSTHMQKDQPMRKAFPCNQCAYIATHKGNLARHKRAHTGERPYKCDECPYSAIHQGSLTAHKRKHTGGRPYKCDECSYASAQKSDLTRHKRAHTGERPYKCDECSYAAARKDHLTNHKRAKHAFQEPSAKKKK
jgi:uncharacterized Zn-finger protein